MNTSTQAKFKRALNGHPVCDAVLPITLYPTLQDTIGAVRGDPRNCVLGLCSKRVFGTDDSLVYGSSLYALTQTEHGLMWFRYHLPTAVTRKVNTFDETGVFPLGGIICEPPTGSNTLEYKRAYNIRKRQPGYMPRVYANKGIPARTKPRMERLSFLRPRSVVTEVVAL